jgi:hypothetical protein
VTTSAEHVRFTPVAATNGFDPGERSADPFAASFLGRDLVLDAKGKGVSGLALRLALPRTSRY